MCGKVQFYTCRRGALKGLFIAKMLWILCVGFENQAVGIAVMMELAKY